MTSTALVKLDQPDAVVLPIQDPAKIYEEARVAVNALMRTFENWITIGKAVVLARKQADESEGRFLEILVDEGIAKALGRTKDSVKVCASRLEKIMRDLTEIEAWRRDELDDTQRLHWSSPSSIFKRFPGYACHKEHRIGGDADPDMPAETVKALKKHNVQLQAESATNKFLVEQMYERGDVFENGDAKEITDYIMESVEDHEKLRLVFIAGLERLGYHVSLRNRNPNVKPKKKSGTFYRKQRAEREAAAAAAAEAKQD
jgi:hypothetical protein